MVVLVELTTANVAPLNVTVGMPLPKFWPATLI